MVQSHQTLLFTSAYSRFYSNMTNMAKRCQFIAVCSFTYPFAFVYVKKNYNCRFKVRHKGATRKCLVITS